MTNVVGKNEEYLKRSNKGEQVTLLISLTMITFMENEVHNISNLLNLKVTAPALPLLEIHQDDGNTGLLRVASDFFGKVMSKSSSKVKSDPVPPSPTASPYGIARIASDKSKVNSKAGEILSSSSENKEMVLVLLHPCDIINSQSSYKDININNEMFNSHIVLWLARGETRNNPPTMEKLQVFFFF